MNCYNHSEKVAVGICSSCNKALCKECAISVDGTLSCDGDCESTTKFARDYLKANIEKSKKHNIKNDSSEYCIFCHSTQIEVEYLIASEDDYSICNYCIDLAQKHIDWARLQEKPYLIRKLLSFIIQKPAVDFGKLGQKIGSTHKPD